MWARAIKSGLLGATLVSLAIALVPSVHHWIVNPGGIFRDADGTHWMMLWDTGWSWFWPIWIGLAPLTIVIGYRREKGNQPT